MRVYEKLARIKHDGESFTRTIDRLVEADSERGTCEQAVREAAAIWKMTPAASEVKIMEQVIPENRTEAGWDTESLE